MIDIICEECKHYTKCNEPYGICKLLDNWELVEEGKTKCKFIPRKLTCKDCENFGCLSCWTQQEDDNICGFFVNSKKNEALEYIYEQALREGNLEDVFTELKNSVNKNVPEKKDNFKQLSLFDEENENE